MSPRPALSIVVPCYNEEACLGELHGRSDRGGARGGRRGL